MDYKILFFILFCVLYVESASLNQGRKDTKRRTNPTGKKDVKQSYAYEEYEVDQSYEEAVVEEDEYKVQYCDETSVDCQSEHGKYMLNPEECTTYCRCEWGRPIKLNCPESLHFNITAQSCDWPIRAGCLEEIAELQVKIAKNKVDNAKKVSENLQTSSKVETTPEEPEPIKDVEKPEELKPNTDEEETIDVAVDEGKPAEPSKIEVEKQESNTEEVVENLISLRARSEPIKNLKIQAKNPTKTKKSVICA